LGRYEANDSQDVLTFELSQQQVKPMRYLTLF
jgi:hypothetical protein